MIKPLPPYDRRVERLRTPDNEAFEVAPRDRQGKIRPLYCQACRYAVSREIVGPPGRNQPMGRKETI